MGYKTRFFTVASLLIGATSALADAPRGTIVLVGKGAASASPEYVTFNVDVTSICYNTSQEAQEANAKMATRLLAILEGFKKGEHDKVTATGGANVRQTETTNIGTDSKVLCELKWRSENHLRIQMAKIADLADLQDHIFAELNQAGGVDPQQAAQTFAEVGRPNFGIYDDTSIKLRGEAQAMAFDDAKLQFNGLAARCAFVEPMLVSITPPEYRSVFKAAGEIVPASYGAPVIPDEMEVSATLRMEWQFTPSSACKTVP